MSMTVLLKCLLSSIILRAVLEDAVIVIFILQKRTVRFSGKVINCPKTKDKFHYKFVKQQKVLAFPA
jgi:hypothetical protein